MKNRVNSVVETVFDTIGTQAVTKNVIVDDAAPSITDPKWYEYVMSHFTEDELIDGKPVVSGLRRVTQLLIGRIASSLPGIVIAPKDDNSIGRATVSWVVTLDNGQVFGDVASSWEGNTEPSFSTYVVEIAATRAEARALRKALCLKVVSADEISSVKAADFVKTMAKSKTTDGEYDENAYITNAQINFINTKAQKLDLNIQAFFKKEFNIAANKGITKKMASDVIEKINEYQQKYQESKSIPKELLGFSDDWI